MPLRRQNRPLLPQTLVSRDRGVLLEQHISGGNNKISHLKRLDQERNAIGVEKLLGVAVGWRRKGKQDVLRGCRRFFLQPSV